MQSPDFTPTGKIWVDLETVWGRLNFEESYKKKSLIIFAI